MTKQGLITLKLTSTTELQQQQQQQQQKQKHKQHTLPDVILRVFLAP